jgi:hypothetical protein
VHLRLRSFLVLVVLLVGLAVVGPGNAKTVPGSLGGGFHGPLQSATTKIPGLVSIVDIAPTALGR